MFGTEFHIIEMIKTYSTSYYHPGLGRDFPIVVEKGVIQKVSGHHIDGSCEVFSKSAYRHVWVPKEYFKIIKKRG